MKLTKDDIAAFIEAWERSFGEMLPYDTAEAEANRLVHFYHRIVDVPVDVTGMSPMDRATMST